jgi:4-methyl-5(b-hydroxyethyl)-thiazole monophosphate biosynthesis
VRHLRADPRCADLARDFADAGLWVAAICAAPLLLSDAGLLQGRRFTAHPSTRDELPGSSGEPVVRDGPIITARGAGVSLLFGLQLVDILCGKQSADSVAASICV